MTTVVTQADLERVLGELGLCGENVVAHVSLKSFGRVEGGPDTVVGAFTATFRNLLMPAFNWGEQSALVAPPPGATVEGNGIDEGFFRSLPQQPQPFDAARTPIHGAMGAVPRALYLKADTRRSGHPLASWLAHGDRAPELVAEQPWDDPHRPLRRLCERSGWVLLCGVGLRACTALHLAEERAGRKTFVRWVVDGSGRTAEVRVGGCSDGFDKLWPALRGLFRGQHLGSARLVAAPLAPLIEKAAELLSRQPELSVCSESCVRCRDVMH